jgi:Protein of unknown function (DUF2809)
MAQGNAHWRLVSRLFSVMKNAQLPESLVHPRFRDREPRVGYAPAGVLVLVLGLFWRSRFFHFPHFLAKYGADALWSVLVYLGLRFLNPRQPRMYAAGMTLLFSYLIEFSQLYHAPWIDGLRRYWLGALILGDTFNWPDFGAYTVGVGVVVSVDAVVCLWLLPGLCAGKLRPPPEA